MEKINLGSPDGPELCNAGRVKEIFKNVVIEILEDDNGNTSIGWYRTPETVELT